jgi:hypothetical protein
MTAPIRIKVGGTGTVTPPPAEAPTPDSPPPSAPEPPTE